MSVLIENVLEVDWKAPVNPSQDSANKSCARRGDEHSLYLEFCTSEHTHHRHIDKVGTLMSSFPGDQSEPQVRSGRFENHAVQV